MGLKAFIQNVKHESNLKDYLALVERQKDSYQSYIDGQERPSLHDIVSYHDANERYVYVHVCPIEKLKEEPVYLDHTAPFILFVPENGYIANEIENILCEAFSVRNDVDVLYFNEDVINSGSKRLNPWFKPRWSPDSLLSNLYMGNVIAVRRNALEEVEYLGSDDPYKNLYDLVLKLTDNSKAMLVNAVVYHGVCDDEMPDIIGATAEYDDIKKVALARRNVNADICSDAYGISHIVYANDGELISIIIPSKDHPEILERCVKSIREKSSYSSYEIVVVDNGSSEQNKAKYQELSEKYNVKYFYEPMDFNFSKMCNSGAKHGCGDYYLFLNDDMEVITNNWLEIMLGQCKQKQVGGVGAKLLYPDSDLIQHAGVTNMTEGPAHKLLGQSDSVCYYHGINRVDRNVMAATAACFMAKKSVFEGLGGFFEGLKVAYNDVDFCFTLVERGMQIVLRNDVLLYHHESLSRGNDHEDKAKLMRLRSERDLLYDRHPELYGEDFFYSPFLTGAGDDYVCMLPYENRNIQPVEELKRVSDVNMSNLNETLIVKADHMNVERHSLKGGKKCMLIDLHAHVRGLDSSDYNYRMLLKSGGDWYEIPATRRFRPDVVKTYNDEKHVELSGFVARIPENMLPSDDFEIWMEARCVFSRQILLNKAKL